MRAVNHDVNSRAQHKRETMMIIWETENTPPLSWTGCWPALNWLFVHRVYSTKIGTKSLFGRRDWKNPFDGDVTTVLRLVGDLLDLVPLPISMCSNSRERGKRKEESPPHPSFPHLPPIKTPHIGWKEEEEAKPQKRSWPFRYYNPKIFCIRKTSLFICRQPKKCHAARGGGRKVREEPKRLSKNQRKV